MLAKILSFGLIGLEGFKVDVEVDVTKGLPSYDTVGLPDTSVKESKERVHSAIKNTGFNYANYRIVINLAPADLKKEGTLFDLPIALGILIATKQLQCQNFSDIIILGELSLDGKVRKVNGILPMLISARQMGYTKFIIPYENRMEASFIEGINIYPVESVLQATEVLSCLDNVEPLKCNQFSPQSQSDDINDFKFIKGQNSGKRAMEIAAAGGHNLIMIGPPGSGKTMMARAFPTILPNLTFEEALEITKIHSVAGVLDDKVGIVNTRPYRAPHHTATTISLTGGGRNAKPGEISLAHNGVLFLDELPEYSRALVESMRQPLEDGIITISRLQQTVAYPAQLTLIASMNPCPCGYYGSKNSQCKCTPSQIHKYLTKLSGPLMDRIDLHVEVDNVDYSAISSNELSESSISIKQRVDNAREIQKKRFINSKTRCNAKMSASELKKYCKLAPDVEKLMKVAFESMNFTARAYSRILKVARTIADLENSENILESHLLEAIQYRSLDEKYWN